MHSNVARHAFAFSVPPLRSCMFSGRYFRPFHNESLAIPHVVYLWRDTNRSIIVFYFVANTMFH
jgi:hypothetical protein